MGRVRIEHNLQYCIVQSAERGDQIVRLIADERIVTEQLSLSRQDRSLLIRRADSEVDALNLN